MIFASQKLRHYMLVHMVHLIAKIDPLKYLLSKAKITRRLAKWMIIFSKFDIQYIEHKAIKGQVIANQLDFPDASIMYVTKRTWKMFFDGSYTQNGAGVGIFFVTPHGYIIPKSYKIFFPCTNNIEEHEALTNGNKMALKWRIIKLHIYGDS